MKASEFDRKFDAGDDVTGDLDLSGARRPRWAARDPFVITYGQPLRPVL